VTGVGCGNDTGWDSDGCDRVCRGFAEVYYGIVGRVRCLSHCHLLCAGSVDCIRQADFQSQMALISILLSLASCRGLLL
jgi:hypothetical protein